MAGGCVLYSPTFTTCGYVLKVARQALVSSLHSYFDVLPVVQFDNGCFRLLPVTYRRLHLQHQSRIVYTTNSVVYEIS